MMSMSDKLSLTAVGSSPLVAAELHRILQTIIGFPIAISDTVTKAVKGAEPNKLYVCANTQGQALKKILPDDKLFVFELTPTTKFFIDIAQIPAGETVLVFNNLFEYTELIIDKCQKLGIDKINFQTAAYEEMPPSDLQRALKNARYIIGVDVFAGEAVLKSASYRKYLRPDVKIISGRRTASVASANRLLAAISDNYYKYFSDRLSSLGNLPLAAASAGDLRELSKRLQEITKGLKESVLQSVTTQVTGQSELLARNSDAWELTLSGDFAADINRVQNQLEQLALLGEKIHKLAK